MLSYLLGYSTLSDSTLTEENAATRITSAIRSFAQRRKWTKSLSTLFGSASVGVTQAHHRAQLAHDKSTSDIYPLDAPLSIFDSFGEGIAAYMHSTPKFREFFFLLFLLSLSNVFENIAGGALGDRITPFNIATIGNLRTLTNSYGAMEFVISACCVRFMFQMRAFLKAEAKRIDDANLTPADFSVQVGGLPRTRDSEEQIGAQLKQALERPHGSCGTIVGVAASRASRTAVLVAQERSLHQARKNSAVAALKVKHDAASADAREAAVVSRLESQRDVETAKVAAANEQLRKMAANSTASLCSGTAFVTFESATEAARVARLGKLRYSAMNGLTATVSLRRAPEPTDILWENLPCSLLECGCRQVLGTLIMLLIAFSGTVLITLGQYLTPTLQEQKDSLTAKLTVQLVGTVAIIAGNLPIFIGVPIIESTVLRHKTFAQKEISIMLKLAFFQVFNTVCASASFVQDTLPTGEGILSRGWYEKGAPLILNVLLGDAFVIGLGVDLLQPGVLMGRYVAAPAALTQGDMDSAYIVPADIYLAFRLQFFCKFIALTLMFGSAIPVLYLLTTFVLFCAPYVDRWNLLRIFPPPARTDNTLMRGVVVYVLPLAILMHIGLCYLFFESITAGGPNKVAVLASLAINGSATVVFILREWSASCFKKRGQEIATALAQPGDVEAETALHSRQLLLERYVAPVH